MRRLVPISYGDIPVVDAWLQHPTEEFLNHDMFAPLLRWQGDDGMPELPLEWTVQAFENGGVDTALISAWWGPEARCCRTNTSRTSSMNTRTSS